MDQVDEAPEGCRWAWVPAREIPSELGWDVIDPSDTKRCRWTDAGIRCEWQSVARLNRGTDRPRWWHYCEEHMFGRRLINGEVWTRILSEVDYPPVVR